MIAAKFRVGLLLLPLLSLCWPQHAEAAADNPSPRATQQQHQPDQEQKAILIWGGGRRMEDASKSLQHFFDLQLRLSERGLRLSEGFPRKLNSSDHPGLNPGFQIAILGVCKPEGARALTKWLRPLHPGLYFRTLIDSPLPYSCPQLHRLSPPSEKRKLRDNDLQLYCAGLQSTIPKQAADRTDALSESSLHDPAKNIDESFGYLLSDLCVKQDPEARQAVASVQTFGPGACFEITQSFYRSGYEETVTYGLPEQERHTRLYCVSKPGKKAKTAVFLLRLSEYIYDCSLEQDDSEDPFCRKNWVTYKGSFKQIQENDKKILCITSLTENYDKFRRALVEKPNGFSLLKYWPRACR